MMGNIERCAEHGRPDCEDCFLAVTLYESVSPDNPIVHGRRWRRERDEAREQLQGAVAEIKRLREALAFYGADETWELPDDSMSSYTEADRDRGERAQNALAITGGAVGP